MVKLTMTKAASQPLPPTTQTQPSLQPTPPSEEPEKKHEEQGRGRYPQLGPLTVSRKPSVTTPFKIAALPDPTGPTPGPSSIALIYHLLVDGAIYLVC